MPEKSGPAVRDVAISVHSEIPFDYYSERFEGLAARPDSVSKTVEQSGRRGARKKESVSRPVLLREGSDAFERYSVHSAPRDRVRRASVF